MIDIALARSLATAGVLWQPAAGDRFTIDEPELVGDVFWISELTIEVHSYQDQTVLGFNGTTEWALDSVPIDVALWLPREDQLRDLVGDRLVSLVRTASGWTVTTDVDGDHAASTREDPEDAYAEALLEIIRAAQP